MSASLRRHALVILLILGAGAAATGLRTEDRPDPAPPPLAALTAGSAWQVEAAYQPGVAGMQFRQWLLRAPDGAEALLFVGATVHAKSVVRWNGEGGYLGDGYVVSGRSQAVLRLDHGSSAPVSRVLVQRLSDRRLLVYATVRPDGVYASGADSPLRIAWDAVAGRGGPYYLVRVSLPATGSASASADRLLSVVLPALGAVSRSGSCTCSGPA
jgi:hypothetical protein